MDLVKTKSPAIAGWRTGRGFEITDRRTVLSVFKISHPAPEVKSQTGGGYENLS